MPFLTPNVTDENDLLATFASQQIRQLATSLVGLDDAQIREIPTASGMNLATLARHAIVVLTGAPLVTLDPDAVPNPLTDPVDYAAGACEPAGVRDTDTAESLIDELRAGADHLEAVIRAADLDRRIPVPEAPWYPAELGSWPARWVAAHCIEEMARHAGHADILRESIDGKGSYELNALADGEEWPPSDAGWGDDTSQR